MHHGQRIMAIIITSAISMIITTIITIIIINITIILIIALINVITTQTPPEAGLSVRYARQAQLRPTRIKFRPGALQVRKGLILGHNSTTLSLGFNSSVAKHLDSRLRRRSEAVILDDYCVNLPFSLHRATKKLVLQSYAATFATAGHPASWQASVMGPAKLTLS